MVLIGVWLLSTNTMGIETTDFILLVVNSRNGMLMLSLEGGKIWLTTTLQKRLNLNSYSIACLLKARTRGQQKLMISCLQVYWNSSPKISGRINLYTTPVFRDRLGWIQSQTTAFDEFILAFRDSGTRTVCQWHETCCFAGCYQVLLGYHSQEREIVSRG